MALGNRVAKSIYSPLAILSLILEGITDSGVLIVLAIGGVMITAGIVGGSRDLVTTDDVAPDVTTGTGNEFVTWAETETVL